MDFHIDDDVRDLAGLVRDMGEQLVTDESLRELDARFGPGTETGGTTRDDARFHARLWSALVSGGVPGALAPESVGGAALGAVAEALVLRELGRVLAPVPLSAAVRGAWLLDSVGPGGAGAGGASLSDRAAAVAEGREIAAVADPGPAGPSGTSSSGPAPEVDWAPIADVIVQPSADGLRVADRASVEVERTVPVDYSCAGLVAGDLGAAVPLPAGAAEFDALRRRVHLAAYQWGVVEAALERTAAYATERHQFGRPIGSFQAVAARLADGSIDVDAVRLTTLRAAFELDACSGVGSEAGSEAVPAPGSASGSATPGPAAHAAVGAAHFWACETGHRLAHSTVHIHGGVGLDRSEPAHRYFLAAKAGEFRLGGATRQLLDLGSTLVEHGDPWELHA